MNFALVGRMWPSDNIEADATACTGPDPWASHQTAGGQDALVLDAWFDVDVGEDAQKPGLNQLRTRHGT